MPDSLPDFCTPPQMHWPLPHPLDRMHLVSCDFDPQLLHADDFDRCGISKTDALQRSVAKRQAEFLAGRLCARRALEALGVGNVVPAVNADRSPLWPAGVTGSITHTTGWAAAIVADSRDWLGLGTDAEIPMNAEQARSLAPEILTANELARLPAHAAHLLVTATFSLKESLFKALYPLVGKYFFFEHAEVLTCSLVTGQARLRLLTDLSATWRHGVEIDAQIGMYRSYLLSLVAIRND